MRSSFGSRAGPGPVARRAWRRRSTGRRSTARTPRCHAAGRGPARARDARRAARRGTCRCDGIRPRAPRPARRTGSDPRRAATGTVAETDAIRARAVTWGSQPCGRSCRAGRPARLARRIRQTGSSERLIEVDADERAAVTDPPRFPTPWARSRINTLDAAHGNAARPQRSELVLHPPRFGERLHRLLLLRRELLRHRHLDLNDQIPSPTILLYALPTHPESLSRRRTLRNLDRHLRPVERLHAHPRAERRLRDVDRYGRDQIQPFTLVEPVRRHGERDEQVARRAILHPFAALPLEADLRSGVDPGGNGDRHLLPGPHFACASACGTPLGWNLAAAEAHRAGPVHGEAALAEADRTAALALLTGDELGAGRGARAMTGAALFVQVELDRHLASERSGAERNLQRRLHVLATLRTAGAGASRAWTSCRGAAAEH